jgi:hypothetical protein
MGLMAKPAAHNKEALGDAGALNLLEARENLSIS